MKKWSRVDAMKKVVQSIALMVVLSGCHTNKPNMPTYPQFPSKVPSAQDWSATLGTGIEPYPGDQNEITPSCAVVAGNKLLLYTCTSVKRIVKPTQPHFKNIAVASSLNGQFFGVDKWNMKDNAFPHNVYNEGACAVQAIPLNGEVWLYYDWATGGGAVRVDVCLFRMAGNGLDVAADGVALKHDQQHPPKPWPGYSGDEVVGCAAYTHNGQWYVYYITDAKGLGVAWGNSPADLPNSVLIQSDVWFMGCAGIQKMDNGHLMVFMVACPRGKMHPTDRFIRVFDTIPELPSGLTHVVDYPTSMFGGSLMGAVVVWFHGKWWMYTNGSLGPHDECWGEIKVMTAQ